MKGATKASRPRARLSGAQVRAFKRLARRVDAEEQEEIKAMGRKVFKRHGAARELVGKLKARRLEDGMSLAELALRMGVAKSNLSRLENNERVSPTLETLQRYAEALGLQMRVELN